MSAQPLPPAWVSALDQTSAMSDLQIVTPAYDSVTSAGSRNAEPPVSPTTTPPPATTDQGLDDLVTALRALEIPDSTLERAREIGVLVLVLSQDPTLSAAALLHFSRRGMDPAPALPAALRTQLGTETVRLADSLGRLGDFHLDDQWSSGQTLGPGQAETVRKMLLAVVGDPRLVLARLAEQTVRARHARELPAKTRSRIALEIQELYAPLANRLGIWSLKWELEDLAFREQQPAEYQRIAQALNEKRRDREQYIRNVLETLTLHLRNAGIEATVQGRPKHIYSIYRKMQRKQLPFEQVFDVRAARVIVPTVADCYAALGVVHDMWPFIPGEFDDYVATPKDNNYQSFVRWKCRSARRKCRTRPNWAWLRTGATRKAAMPTGATTRRSWLYDSLLKVAAPTLTSWPGSA